MEFSESEERVKWLGWGLWGLALGLAAVALLLGLAGGREEPTTDNLPTAIPISRSENLTSGTLPDLLEPAEIGEISRRAQPQTEHSSGLQYEILDYTVLYGDSIFSIAHQFNLRPESVLWANEATLGGRPDILEPGMRLFIPPTDGVVHLWEDEDTLEAVAHRYEVEADAILEWPGNEIADLTNPAIASGSLVMVPNGIGQFQQWVFPDPTGGGVSASLLGPGACTGDYPRGNGSGSFVWPSPIHTIVGNDYWQGHQALDIASGEGIGVYAADAGMVLFAGWAVGGYGYMVYLDHGNGYSSLYAHLGQVVATCGSQVAKGAVIGYGGSTGNSTGPHLHFELRFQGGFLNPWQVLPVP